MKLYYCIDGGYRCDQYGQNILNDPNPVLSYGSKPTWTVTVLNADGTAASLTGVATFRAAVDADLSSSTVPMCRTLASAITVSENTITVPLETKTAQFLTKVDGKAAVSAYFEIWGYDTNANPVFYAKINITASATVDPDGGEAPATSSGYMTEAEALALIGAANLYQFSVDGSTSWHDTFVSADCYYRERKNVTGSVWGAALPLRWGGSTVTAAATGTSTTEAKYLTIDGTEWKLPEGDGSGSTVTASATGSSANIAKYLTIDGSEWKLEGTGSTVTASETGSSTTVAKYLTIDGTQWKLPEGSGTGSVAWSDLTGTAPSVSTFSNDAGYLTSIAWSDLTGTAPTGADLNLSGSDTTKINAAIAAKTSVSASITGTATTVAKYLTIDGTEWKLPDDDVTSVNGLNGAVTLYGSNIMLSESSGMTSIKAAIEAKSHVVGYTTSQEGSSSVLRCLSIDGAMWTLDSLVDSVNGKSGTVVLYGSDILMSSGASATTVYQAITDHTGNESNPHNVTASQVGLGSVVNTGDSATPVSGGQEKFTTGGAYTELEKKQDLITSSNPLSYSLLSDTPTIPAAQIQSDWNQTDTSALDYVKNKPTIPDAVSASVEGSSSSTVAKYLTIGNTEWKLPEGGGTGAVSSVNTKTGAVVLYGSDIDMSEYDTRKLNAVIAEKSAVTLSQYPESMASLAQSITLDGVTTWNLSPIESVNTKTGAVVLYGSDIAVSSGDSTTIDVALSGKADSSSLAAVATSGSYNDLSDTPTIPDAVSASTTGTSTTEAKYITIGNTEWKLPEGGTAPVTSVNAKTGAVVLYGADMQVSSSDPKTLDTAIYTKADAATTLAGYGITDAKIESGVITLGYNTITPLTSVTWSDLTGTAPSVSTFSNDAGYLTSVTWSDLTGTAPSVSTFSNDAGYLTSVAWSDLTGTAPTGADLNLSGSDTTKINAAIAAKANSATTLSGYGITDAKIESGVITLGSNTITPLTSVTAATTSAVGGALLAPSSITWTGTTAYVFTPNALNSRFANKTDCPFTTSNTSVSGQVVKINGTSVTVPTVSTATTSAAGVALLATDSEISTGTETAARIVTPLQLATYFEGKITPYSAGTKTSSWVVTKRMEYGALTASTACTLTISTTVCPAGAIVSLRVANSNGGSLTFGSETLIATTDTSNYLLTFVNINGTVECVGSKVEVK